MLSKQKHSLRRGMRKPCKLNLGRYAGRLIDHNEYLDTLPGTKAGDMIVDMKLNEILFNSMGILRRKKVSVKGFDCETVTF